MANDLRIISVGKTRIALYDRVAAEVVISGDVAASKQALAKVLRALNPIVGKGVELTGTMNINAATLNGDTPSGIQLTIKFNQSVEEEDVVEEDSE